MSNKGKEIMELLNRASASASDVTAALKAIGDGNMLDGVKNIVDYEKVICSASGEKKGFAKGGVAGIAVCGALYLVPKGVSLIKNKAAERKAHEEMGEKIYTAFSEELGVNPDTREVEDEEAEGSES